jgi:uncharacterized protein (TIGR02246 family)
MEGQATGERQEGGMLTSETVRQEIEASNREFMTAFNRGDAAGVAAAYTEDGRVLPAGAPALSGRQAVEQFWRSVMDMGVRRVELRTEHAEAVGALAYEIGSAALMIRPEGGAAATDTVTYVVVRKRQAGGPWQLAVDIWNGNTSA